MCVFYLPVDDGGKPTGSQLTVDDLFQKDFQIHDPDAKWINSKYVKGFGKSCLSHELSIHCHVYVAHFFKISHTFSYNIYFKVHYFPRYLQITTVVRY